MNDDTERFRGRILARANAKLQAQRIGAPPVSLGLGMFGIIGWSVAVPTVLGALLGHWLDAHHRGAHAWTLALLVTGLVVGCASAGVWISAQTRLLGPQSESPQEAGHD